MLKTSCFTDGKYQFDANRHTNNKVTIVILAFVEHNLNFWKNENPLNFNPSVKLKTSFGNFIVIQFLLRMM